MKLQYENPIIEIVEFSTEDILTNSGGIGQVQPGDNDKDYGDFWEN